MIESEEIKRIYNVLELLREGIKEHGARIAIVEQTLKQREEIANFLRSAILAIGSLIVTAIIALIGHMTVTIWWASKLDYAVDELKKNDNDQKQIMRELIRKQYDLPKPEKYEFHPTDNYDFVKLNQQNK